MVDSRDSKECKLLYEIIKRLDILIENNPILDKQNEETKPSLDEFELMSRKEMFSYAKKNEIKLSATLKTDEMREVLCQQLQK